jgi:hypothetical protein
MERNGIVSTILSLIFYPIVNLQLTRTVPTPLGSLLYSLTGHRNLVTNLDMVTYPATESEEAVDVIVSVSDDKTAKVFHTKDYFA